MLHQVDVYMPAFRASGLLMTVQDDGSGIPTDAATKLITACTTVYLAPLVANGLDMTGLSQLVTCDFTGACNAACVWSRGILR